MSKVRELSKNTIIIFIGKFCTQFLSFLLIPIYTRYLLTEDYGYIDLVQTYITLIFPILILRFDSAIFRFLIDARKNKNRKIEIISSSLFIIFFQILLFCVIYFFVARFVSIKYAWAIVLNIITIALSNIFLQLTRGVGDNVNYSIGCVISAIVTLLLNIIFIIYLDYDASYILIASSIGNILCIIYLVLKNNLFSYVNMKCIKRDSLTEMLKYSIPMIPDGLSWWVMNVSDRTIISLVMGTKMNGIYSVSCKFSNILSSLFQIFNMSWQESASVHIGDDDKDTFFSSIFNNVIMIYFSVCLIIMVFIPPLFSIIIGEDYISSYSYIPLLLLANVFNAAANIFGAIYIANKNTKQVAKTTFISAIINFVLNIVLIKKIGLWAAVISTLVSYIIIAIYRGIHSRKYVNIKIDYKTIIFLLVVFIFSMTLYEINIVYINIVNIIIVISICGIINKKNVYVLFKIIFRKKKN